jgi:hypothetical protein
MYTFVLGERSYQIRPITAEDGSFLAFKFVNKLREVMSGADRDEKPDANEKQPTQEEAIRGTISLVLMNMNEDEFKLVQRKALALIDEFTAVGQSSEPIPITRNGAIIAPALKGDVQALIQLTNESLYQNLGPFFSENGLKLVMTGKV